MNKYKIEDLCEIKSGGTPRRSRDEFFGGNILWAKIGDISSSDGVIYETEEKITQEGLENINNRIFKKGTLLFSMYGSIGKVAIAGKDMSTNQAILGINIKDPSKLDQQYLNHWFTYKKKKLENETRGVTLKNLSATKVKNLDISLPPFETQKKIAVVLDKADALRQERRQTIEKLDELTQSVFLDMFGDPNTNPKSWKKIKLKDITRITSGSTPSRKNKKYYGGDIPWVKTGEVTGNLIFKTEEYITELGLDNSSCDLHPINTILIAMYGQGKTRGNVGLLKIRATTNQACAAIEPCEQIEPLYLFSLLKVQYEYLRSLGRGGNQANLNVGMVKDYEAVIPPLELQKKFVHIHKKIQQQYASYNSNSQILNNLFNSLLQKAFKGELNFSDSEEPLLAAEETAEY